MIKENKLFHKIKSDHNLKNTSDMHMYINTEHISEHFYIKCHFLQTKYQQESKLHKMALITQNRHQLNLLIPKTLLFLLNKEFKCTTFATCFNTTPVTDRLSRIVPTSTIFETTWIPANTDLQATLTRLPQVGVFIAADGLRRGKSFYRRSQGNYIST